MKPIIDPRGGDIEDDASSTKRRSLLSLAGSLLVEISLPKLAVAWTLLIGLPSIILGMAPLLLSLWIGTVSWKASIILTGVWPVVLLLALGVLAWFAGLPLVRLIESSFWSLNALGVQPVYVACREGLRHTADRLLPHGASAVRRVSVRAASAAASGLAISMAALWLVVLAWPASRWVGNFAVPRPAPYWGRPRPRCQQCDCKKRPFSERHDWPPTHELAPRRIGRHAFGREWGLTQHCVASIALQ